MAALRGSEFDLAQSRREKAAHDGAEPAVSKTLFILNDPPYGSERSYNALRLATMLARAEGEEVRLFLLGDAASCANKVLVF